MIASEIGGYLATAAIQDTPSPTNLNGIGFFLGNSDPTTGVEDTLLPVTATYRMTRDPWMTPVSALGLPVQPVVATQRVIVNGFRPFGPSHGPGYGFEAFLAPGVYERTVVPAPPYDAIFGPAIDEADSVTVQSPAPDVITVTQFDPTMLILPYPGHPILPRLQPLAERLVSLSTVGRRISGARRRVASSRTYRRCQEPRCRGFNS